MNKTPSLTRFRLLRLAGGIIAYGCLAAFLCLIAVQLYRWFREGEWTRIGISDGSLNFTNVRS